MAITSDDIKLMQPERLSDDEDGGGQMTGLEVIDGDINNLFEDISRVNRTYGNVSLRKAFLKVDTATADLYLDAHAILSAQPEDPNVSGLLFTTNDFYDERDTARQRIEAFVIPGPVTGFHLRGTQLQGQRSIICYASATNNLAPPEIGDTLMLQVGSILATQQFIKVLDVDHQRVNFTYEVSGGQIRTFWADQYILQLSADLKQDFPAVDPHPYPDSPTRIYSTQTAVSAKYYGTTTLRDTALPGSSSVRVETTFAPIIPTASSETPVIDQRPGGFISYVMATAAAPISLSATITAGATSTLPTAIVPGSISFTAGGSTYTDKGGIFVNASGNPGALEGSTIDYYTGVITWGGTLGSASISFMPGSLRQQLPNTGKIEIDDTNRSFNYVLSLDPPPSPTTFHASYQYLGKWYEIHDDGTGLLVGDGGGQVNYDTGSIIITLQAQPDANSTIFYRWTESGMYTRDLSGIYSASTPATLYMGVPNIIAGSVELTWMSGEIAQIATDDGDGNITGDATGTIEYSRGIIRLSSASAPDDGGWNVAYDYESDPAGVTTVTIPDNEDRSDIILQLPPNLRNGGITFSINKTLRLVVEDEHGVTLSEKDREYLQPMSDSGSGVIMNRRTNKAVGTVNYTTGEVLIIGETFLDEHESSES